MNRLQTLACTLLLLIGTTGIFQSLTAQTITETLQKRIWSLPTTHDRDAWDLLLPAPGQDTVFYEAILLAEVLTTDEDGLPVAVTTLKRESNGWLPVTRTHATFDQGGHVIALESWKWEGGQWQNESRTIRNRDHQANDLSVELELWEDGHWNPVWTYPFEMPMVGATAGNAAY